ncbi:MAG: ABC transporter ATP-binding protein [Chloroflexi bacterium]|nr:ABC transporter ATP-binding protein [Chloroflexota bacterium]
MSLRRGRSDGPGADENRALRRALAYLWAYRAETFGALLAIVLVSAANLAVPQLIRVAIDVGIGGRQSGAIAAAVGGLLLVAAIRGLFTFLQGYLSERASQGVAYDLRDALFAHIEHLSFSYYDRVQTGQLLTRLTNDVEQIRTFVGNGVVQLAASLIMLAGSCVLLLSLNWRLALVALATIPAILLVLLRFVRRIGPLFMQVQSTLGRLNTLLQEGLAGIRVIRAFVREDYETERYRGVNESLLETNLATIRAISNSFPFVFLFANLGTLAVVWYGGVQVIGGGLTIGELVAFNAYLSFLLFPVLAIGFLAAGISRAGASAARVFEVLDAPLDVHDVPGAWPLPPVQGWVQFEDVHFRYSGSEREVLRGVGFSVEPGQTVAILGTTGSGKSTIVNLLPRFYDVTGGRVTIDGHDVRRVTLASLRSQIGIVLQEALLFSGPVRDNIAYGKPDASLEEIQAAARDAQADEFIRDLPQGYDTVIGERGVGLSGGQRQRIAIARALLVNPRLLILDDSTSAVDAATEAAIQAALDRLMRDRRRTAFVIAQRISTVRDADLILVLDEGRIATQGTHEELLRDSPLYNEILGSQLQVEQAA